MLASDVKSNDVVPKEYNLQITNETSVNTFIFTERDVPGYDKLKVQVRQGPKSTTQPFSQAIPRIHVLDRHKPRSTRFEKGRRFHQYHRKAVPSKFSARLKQTFCTADGVVVKRKDGSGGSRSY